MQTSLSSTAKPGATATAPSLVEQSLPVTRALSFGTIAALRPFEQAAQNYERLQGYRKILKRAVDTIGSRAHKESLARQKTFYFYKTYDRQIGAYRIGEFHADGSIKTFADISDKAAKGRTSFMLAHDPRTVADPRWRLFKGVPVCAKKIIDVHQNVLLQNQGLSRVSTARWANHADNMNLSSVFSPHNYANETFHDLKKLNDMKMSCATRLANIESALAGHPLLHDLAAHPRLSTPAMLKAYRHIPKLGFALTLTALVPDIYSLGKNWTNDVNARPAAQATGPVGIVSLLALSFAGSAFGAAQGKKFGLKGLAIGSLAGGYIVPEWSRWMFKKISGA